MKSQLIISSLILAVMACSPVTQKQAARNIQVQAGLHHGGLVENASDAAAVDAYTGATTMGGQAGVYLMQPVGNHQVRLGTELLTSHHALNYHPSELHSQGTRQIQAWHMRVPAAWHLCFWQKRATVQLGISAGYSWLQTQDKQTGLPSFETAHFSLGPLMGVSLSPFRLPNQAILGVHAEVFRSGHLLYTDTWNQPGMEGTGVSYFKAGIHYSFPLTKH